MTAPPRRIVRWLGTVVALAALAALAAAGLWAYRDPSAQLAIANLWSLCGLDPR